MTSKEVFMNKVRAGENRGFPHNCEDCVEYNKQDNCCHWDGKDTPPCMCENIYYKQISGEVTE